MSAINYDKWNNIEISDDEDDTHPNVDTPSLFKWRHEARIQREDEERKEREQRLAFSKMRKMKIKEVEEKLKKVAPEDAGSAGGAAQAKGLATELEELKKREKEFLEKEAQLEREMREHPKWNVDNISKEKASRTIINKPKPKSDDPKDEGEAMSQFFKKHKDELRKFGLMSKPEDSHKFLKANHHLMCEHLGSYLVIWAIDLKVEKKDALVEHVAKQCIVVQYIMELAKSMKIDPRDCIDPFFMRLKSAEPQYIEAFTDEYKALMGRIEKRAQVRIEEAMKEIEAEEREKRLGPGGLDPLEIMEKLPKKIKDAFETQNTPMLQEGFAELPPEEAQKLFKECVDSGLWVPAAGGGGGDEAGDEGEAAAAAE